MHLRRRSERGERYERERVEGGALAVAAGTIGSKSPGPPARTTSSACGRSTSPEGGSLVAKRAANGTPLHDAATLDRVAVVAADGSRRTGDGCLIVALHGVGADVARRVAGAAHRHRGKTARQRAWHTQARDLLKAGAVTVLRRGAAGGQRRRREREKSGRGDRGNEEKILHGEPPSVCFMNIVTLFIFRQVMFIHFSSAAACRPKPVGPRRALDEF